MDPNNDRNGTYVKRRGDTIIKVYDYCVRSLFMNTEIKVACTLFADNSIAVCMRQRLKSSFGTAISSHCR